MSAAAFTGAKALITGGLGFVGSNLARRLVGAGAKVTLIDSLIPEYGGNPFNVQDIRDRVSVSITDVRDPHAMAHLVQGQDYLFNLAGQTSHLDSMSNPMTDLEINAAAQLSILEACRQHSPKVKLVFASTRQLYGRPRYLPVDEKHPASPVDVNGINKLAGEQYHLLYNDVYGLRACCLRLTNTYGPAMRVKDARQTFLGVWLRNALQDKPILVYGDGSQLRDFNYVDDAVDALLIAAADARADGKVFNLGSTEVVSLKALAELLLAVHGKGRFDVVPFPAERKAIDIGDYYSDFGKIRRELGWTPKVGLREGLERTLRYYAEHGARYWDPA
jgi:dTDP-glucose 4,6-dehydratase/UDP-glucose 4-epimerase